MNDIPKSYSSLKSAGIYRAWLRHIHPSLLLFLPHSSQNSSRADRSTWRGEPYYVAGGAEEGDARGARGLIGGKTKSHCEVRPSVAYVGIAGDSLSDGPSGDPVAAAQS